MYEPNNSNLLGLVESITCMSSVGHGTSRLLKSEECFQKPPRNIRKQVILLKAVGQPSQHGRCSEQIMILRFKLLEQWIERRYRRIAYPPLYAVEHVETGRALGSFFFFPLRW